MIAAGLARKRPPHMVLVTSVEPCVKGEVSEEDVNRSEKRDRDASPATIVIAALLAAIAGFGTVYLSFAPSDNGRFASSVKQDEGGAAAPAGGKRRSGPARRPEQGRHGGVPGAAEAARPRRGQLRRRRRRDQVLERLAGQGGAPQHLGHLVRALPGGDADARQARGGARRQGFPGGRGEYRPGRRRQAEELPRRDRRHASCALHRSFGQTVQRAEGGRHADNAADRPRRTRDRPPGRSGRLGFARGAGPDQGGNRGAAERGSAGAFLAERSVPDELRQHRRDDRISGSRSFRARTGSARTRSSTRPSPRASARSITSSQSGVAAVVARHAGRRARRRSSCSTSSRATCSGAERALSPPMPRRSRSPSGRSPKGSTRSSRSSSARSSTMPFQHSEDRADQARAVALFTVLGNPLELDFALRHQAVVDRFGRFPHRNAVLGRVSTEEEQAFLAKPGSSF